MIKSLNSDLRLHSGALLAVIASELNLSLPRTVRGEYWHAYNKYHFHPIKILITLPLLSIAQVI